MVWSITAIAIGVTTAIVAVADPVLFQPLPFRASSELVVLPAVRIPAENDNKLAALAPAEILTLNDIARMTTVFHGTG
ncbi:MAG: hypothetical protein ACRELE_02995, partial [Gemmatimonadales bacterium]